MPGWNGPSWTAGCQPRAGDLNGDGQEDLVLLPSESSIDTMSIVLVNP